MNQLHTPRRAVLLLLFLACEGGLAGMLWNRGAFDLAAALVIPHRDYLRWVTIEPDEVEEGASVPADVNVIFHLPLDQPDIERETLLGNRGQEMRYWGYCFPDGYDPADPPQTYGFPGRLFLSEAERAVREQRTLLQIPRYSIFRPPTRSELERDEALLARHSVIRHQIEKFHGGQNCYIMTSTPLPIGTDRDDDGLNAQLEKQYGTDVNAPDTDGDGLADGTEVFDLHTDPLNPDSDGDGLPDGIETHGHSKVLIGDTDPLNADSDHDGLCDGFCPVDRNRRYCTPEANMRCADTTNRWAGEDKNLDGAVDTDGGETDPLKSSTFDDGILDNMRYYQCLLDGGTNC